MRLAAVALSASMATGCGPDVRHLGDLPVCDDQAIAAGEACFEASARELAIGFDPLHVFPGDFDGDAFIDVIATGVGNGIVTERWRGSDRGPVAPSDDPGLTGCSGYPVRGRLGADPFTDVVFGTCEESADVYFGATAAFTAPVRVSLPLLPFSSEIVDVDGDGVPDLFTVGVLAGDVPALSIAISDPGAGPAAGVLVMLPPLAFVPNGLSAGDLDGDGRIDAVLRESTQPDALVIASGVDTSGIAAVTPLALGLVASTLAIGPLGRPHASLVVADREAGKLCVLHAIDELPVCLARDDWRPASMAIADLGADDVPEIVVADPSAAELSVLVVTDQAVEEVGSLPVPTGADLVYILDVDADATLDVLAAHFAVRTFSIRLGIP